MRNFFFFLARNRTALFFLVLEALCAVLIVKYNGYQQARYVSSANAVGGVVYGVESAVTGYFGLRSENNALLAENNALRNQLDMLHAQIKQMCDSSVRLCDLPPQRNIIRDARVVKSTTNRARNYLTIDRGTSGGVKPDMVALSGGAVVGLVTAASENYAIVLPLINAVSHLSVKLKNTNHRGLLVWPGVNSHRSEMIDVPEHATVTPGDTIVTSGSSDFYPEGLMVGTVSDVELDRNGGFYTLTVQLAVDFNSVYDVEIIENLLLAEQRELETQNTRQTE